MVRPLLHLSSDEEEDPMKYSDLNDSIDSDNEEWLPKKSDEEEDSDYEVCPTTASVSVMEPSSTEVTEPILVTKTSSVPGPSERDGELDDTTTANDVTKPSSTTTSSVSVTEHLSVKVTVPITEPSSVPGQSATDDEKDDTNTASVSVTEHSSVKVTVPITKPSTVPGPSKTEGEQDATTAVFINVSEPSSQEVTEPSLVTEPSSSTGPTKGNVDSQVPEHSKYRRQKRKRSSMVRPQLHISSDEEDDTMKYSDYDDSGDEEWLPKKIDDEEDSDDEVFLPGPSTEKDAVNGDSAPASVEVTELPSSEGSSKGNDDTEVQGDGEGPSKDNDDTEVQGDGAGSSKDHDDTEVQGDGAGSSKGNDDTEMQGDAQSRGQKRKPTCPECLLPKAKVARHLVTIHKWSPEMATKWYLYTDSGRRRQSKNKKRGRTQCSICQLPVTRLAQHMRIMHNRKIEKKKSPPTLQLDNFVEFLTGAAGGQRSQTQANRYKYCVSEVLNSIAPGNDLRQVFRVGDDDDDSPGNRMEKMVFNQLSKKVSEWTMAASSAQNYFYAFKMYLAFLETSRPRLLKMLQIDPGSIQALKEKTKQLAKAFTKGRREQRYSAAVRSEKTKISNETLIHHQNSEEHRRLKQIIENIDKGSKPNHGEEEVIKRQLIFLLVSRNGQRSGTIINMKIQDLNESTEKDGEVIIRVSNHKTFSTYGPAHLAIKLEYMSALRFLKGNRSNDSPLFTSKLGKQIDAGFINDCLSEVAKFLGHKGRVTSTMLRKNTATAVKNAPDPVRREIAAHMSHHLGTADKYYVVEDANIRASRAVKMIDTARRIQQPLAITAAPPSLTAPAPVEVSESSSIQPTEPFSAEVTEPSSVQVAEHSSAEVTEPISIPELEEESDNNDMCDLALDADKEELKAMKEDIEAVAKAEELMPFPPREFIQRLGAATKSLTTHIKTIVEEAKGLPDKNELPSKTEGKAATYREAIMIRFGSDLMILADRCLNLVNEKLQPRIALRAKLLAINHLSEIITAPTSGHGRRAGWLPADEEILRKHFMPGVCYKIRDIRIKADDKEEIREMMKKGGFTAEQLKNKIRVLKK